MRILMNIRFPTPEFNALMRSGAISETMNHILDELKPENVYFTEQGGQRMAILIVNLDQAASIPRLAEPWFLKFNAIVEFHAVMTPDDLKASGLESLAQKWA